MALDAHGFSALLGLDAPWSPARVVGTPQVALLFGRVALVVAAAIDLSMRARGDAEERRPAFVRFVAIAALEVASLVWAGTWLPAVVLSLALLSRSRAASKRTKAIGASAAVLLILTAGAWPAPSHVAPSMTDESPPEATTRALERGNSYEARFWAARWAALEREDPRDGALIWARVENESGHVELARRIASDVVARSSQEAVRARAQSLLVSISHPPGGAQ